MFSLLGLLVGVGVTVWLSSRVLDAGAPRPRSDRRTTSTTGADAVGATVALDPATGLGDGQRVRLTGTGFPAGTTVEVRQCLSPSAGAALVLGAGARCDEANPPTTAIAGRDGRVAVDVVVRVVVTAGSLPFDCAESAGFCSLLATTTGEAPTAGTAPLTFAAGTRPELTLPPG